MYRTVKQDQIGDLSKRRVPLRCCCCCYEKDGREVTLLKTCGLRARSREPGHSLRNRDPISSRLPCTFPPHCLNSKGAIILTNTTTLLLCSLLSTVHEVRDISEGDMDFRSGPVTRTIVDVPFSALPNASTWRIWRTPPFPRGAITGLHSASPPTPLSSTISTASFDRVRPVGEN